MKAAWMTDIHLDCVGGLDTKLSELAEKCKNCEYVILSGDISVAPALESHLSMLEAVLQKPFYFVLGNHDYYFSDIMTVRRRVVEHCRRSEFARYLAAVPYVKLQPKTAIVGHDGWYDALNGDAMRSDIIMNDWIKIQDFSIAIKNSYLGKTLDKGAIIHIARLICAASVKHIAAGIRAAVRDGHDRIIIVNHVPPFKESYNSDKYRGVDSSTVIPWYTSRTMGDTLFAAARAYPNVHFTSLSGHAHSHYDEYLLNNLNVRVGNSSYGSPQIAGYVDI
jgi:predicted phosphohydrolase